MGEVRLDQTELEAILELEEGIRDCHLKIGFLREREAQFLARLINLRERAINWENQIGTKYNLPQGIKWSLDPKTGVVTFEGEREKGPAAEKPAPVGSQGES